MNPFLKAMQPPKKRPVDPNAPPRPNLLSHDKTIRETTATMVQLQQQNQQLTQRVAELESKMIRQTQYLQALHQSITAKSRS